MRRLRLAVVGAVVLALLGPSSSTVVAQDADTASFDEPYAVTGQVRNPLVKRNWDWTWDEERQVEESKMYTEQRIELDDPRLSGLLLRTWNVETYGGRRHGGLGEVMAGSAQLINDGGTWVGTDRGYATENPRWHYWQFELTGTGAYEGHSALLWTQGPSAGPKEVEGFVFPGPLPEYPPEPEAIIDPVEVVVAELYTAAGDKLRPVLRFVSAVEVGADVLTDIGEAKWRTAAVDIPAGTPITPDLLEPAE